MPLEAGDLTIVGLEVRVGSAVHSFAVGNSGLSTSAERTGNWLPSLSRSGSGSGDRRSTVVRVLRDGPSLRLDAVMGQGLFNERELASASDLEDEYAYKYVEKFHVATPLHIREGEILRQTLHLSSGLAGGNLSVPAEAIADLRIVLHTWEEPTLVDISSKANAKTKEAEDGLSEISLIKHTTTLKDFSGPLKLKHQDISSQLDIIANKNKNKDIVDGSCVCRIIGGFDPRFDLPQSLELEWNFSSKSKVKFVQLEFEVVGADDPLVKLIPSLIEEKPKGTKETLAPYSNAFKDGVYCRKSSIDMLIIPLLGLSASVNELSNSCTDLQVKLSVEEKKAVLKYLRKIIGRGTSLQDAPRPKLRALSEEESQASQKNPKRILTLRNVTNFQGSVKLGLKVKDEDDDEEEEEDHCIIPAKSSKNIVISKEVLDRLDSSSGLPWKLASTSSDASDASDQCIGLLRVEVDKPLKGSSEVRQALDLDLDSDSDLSDAQACPPVKIATSVEMSTPSGLSGLSASVDLAKWSINITITVSQIAASFQTSKSKSKSRLELVVAVVNTDDALDDSMWLEGFPFTTFMLDPGSEGTAVFTHSMGLYLRQEGCFKVIPMIRIISFDGADIADAAGSDTSSAWFTNPDVYKLLV